MIRFLRIAAATLSLALCTAQSVRAQQELNENCMVSVLNRTVRVSADGSWELPNVPAGIGKVKARVTCTENGVTTSGESDFFTIAPNVMNAIPGLVLGSATQIPVALRLAPANGTLTSLGQTVPLSVTATYGDGSTKNVTAASTGTNYTTSNAAIASVSADGLVTAVASGTVIIQVNNDGTPAIVLLKVALSNVDSDGDGIPDDVEIAHGLNPNDPVDAQEDFDRDGLTNLQEITAGTDPRNADTDGDGLNDGQELALGTNPLLRDTDGDGVSDGLEVQTGSDPLNPNSVNLAAALTSLTVTPASFVLSFSTIATDVFQPLTVTGHLRDGTTIDLTSTARGTSYSSSDLAVCNFSATSGQVFAGIPGACTITIVNAGFTATSVGTARIFTPAPLSFVSIPGYANNVDVSGDFAYVAAGSAGLQIVDVSNRNAPRVVASLDTPGNANDVKIAGTLAFIADGAAGLEIVDIANPLAPRLVGSVHTPGDAWDVAVAGGLVYVADGASGLQIVDASSPAAPHIVESVLTSATARGVDVSGTVAVVASGFGVDIVDVSNLAAPVVVGRAALPDNARDVAVRGTVAYVADFTGSLQVVDFATPSGPAIIGSTTATLGGYLTDVAVSGSFVFGADVVFVNAVPVTDVTVPANPASRALIDFSNFRDDNGTGIAVDGSYVYLTAARDIVENGIAGDTRLYIAQFRAFEDLAGIPPLVRIVAPVSDTAVVEGDTLQVVVDATDDVAVQSVSFFANGLPVATDPTSPYTLTLTVPHVAGTLTLGATAIDLGSNVGTAGNVRVNIIPDPLTTVVAKVVDHDGHPVAGAVVTVAPGGLSGITNPDGAVSIAAVETMLGPIRATAVFVAPDGSAFSGASSDVAPVRGGITDLGTLTLGAFVYYAYNPVDTGQLTLVGWADGTAYRVVRLDAPSAVVATGTIGRFDTKVVPLGGVRHFKLEASAPLLPLLVGGIRNGEDADDAGSFFYPTIDGTSFVGQQFVIRTPDLGSQNLLAFTNHEDGGTVTIRDTAGAVVKTFGFEDAGDRFEVDEHSGLSSYTVYQVESTRRIAIQSDAEKAHTTVPSADGGDIGKRFLLSALQGNSNGIALFAYENATILALNLITREVVFSGTLAAGHFKYVDIQAEERYTVISTGNIAVWSGATKKASSSGTPIGIDFLGDNLTINTGNLGLDTLIHTQAQGAFLFASQNNTLVNVGGVGGAVATLNAGEFIDLAPSQFLRVVADKPVIIETIGGEAPLRNWATVLKRIVDLPPSIDRDGDGLADSVEVRIGLSPVSTDTDGNGINDLLDDSDHDGLSNQVELARGLNPANADTDGDGLLDGVDDAPFTPERIPPTVSVRNPVSGSTLFEGQTLTVAVDAADNAAVRSVSLFVNGAAFGTATTTPYEFLFTVPYGLNSLTFGATARDFAGNTATATPSVVSVSPNAPSTRVQGTVVDTSGAPIERALVTVKPGGLKAELFNFDTPLAAMPDLSGRAPDAVRHVSAVNFVNPNNVLASDTFGTGLAPDYAIRLSGFIRLPAAGAYKFVLGADDGARLFINGNPIVEATPHADFTEVVSASVTLPAGTLPIEIDYFQSSGDAELRLSYITPTGTRQVVPSSLLLGPDDEAVTALTGVDGTFSAAGVPALGSISATVRASVGEEDLVGSVPGIAPVLSGTTDLGQIVVAPPQFETRIGTQVPPCGFCILQVTLPFAFPFGPSYQDAELFSHNGSMRFGGDGQLRLFAVPTVDDTSDPASGLYINDQLPGRYVVTWLKQRDPSGQGGYKTFQLTLFPDGRFRFGYNGIAPPYAPNVGVLPGNPGTFANVDFSTAPLSTTAGAVVTETFANGHPFDLDPGFLYFVPNAAGGYDITFVPGKVGE